MKLQTPMFGDIVERAQQEEMEDKLNTNLCTDIPDQSKINAVLSDVQERKNKAITSSIYQHDRVKFSSDGFPKATRIQRNVRVRLIIFKIFLNYLYA